MGIFDFIFKRQAEPEVEPVFKEEIREAPAEVIEDLLPDWLGDLISAEEEELVAAIATACLANSIPGATFRVKKVQPVDEDWLVAGLAAIAGVANETGSQNYRIKSIKRIK